MDLYTAEEELKSHLIGVDDQLLGQKRPSYYRPSYYNNVGQPICYTNVPNISTLPPPHEWITSPHWATNYPMPAPPVAFHASCPGCNANACIEHRHQSHQKHLRRNLTQNISRLQHFSSVPVPVPPMNTLPPLTPRNHTTTATSPQPLQGVRANYWVSPVQSPPYQVGPSHQLYGVPSACILSGPPVGQPAQHARVQCTVLSPGRILPNSPTLVRSPQPQTTLDPVPLQPNSCVLPGSLLCAPPPVTLSELTPSSPLPHASQFTGTSSVASTSAPPLNPPVTVSQLTPLPLASQFTDASGVASTSAPPLNPPVTVISPSPLPHASQFTGASSVATTSAPPLNPPVTVNLLKPLPLASQATTSTSAPPLNSPVITSPSPLPHASQFTSVASARTASSAPVVITVTSSPLPGTSTPIHCAVSGFTSAPVVTPPATVTSSPLPLSTGASTSAPIVTPHCAVSGFTSSCLPLANQPTSFVTMSNKSSVVTLDDVTSSTPLPLASQSKVISSSTAICTTQPTPAVQANTTAIPNRPDTLLPELILSLSRQLEAFDRLHPPVSESREAAALHRAILFRNSSSIPAETCTSLVNQPNGFDTNSARRIVVTNDSQATPKSSRPRKLPLKKIAPRISGTTVVVANSSQATSKSSHSRKVPELQSFPHVHETLSECGTGHTSNAKPGPAEPKTVEGRLIAQPRSLFLVRLDQNEGRMESDIDDENRLCIDDAVSTSPISKDVFDQSVDSDHFTQSSAESVKASLLSPVTKPVLSPCARKASRSRSSESPGFSDEGYLSATTPHTSDTAELCKQLPFSSFLQSYSCNTPVSNEMVVEQKGVVNTVIELNTVIEEVLMESKDYEADSSGEEAIDVEEAMPVVFKPANKDFVTYTPGNIDTYLVDTKSPLEQASNNVTLLDSQQDLSKVESKLVMFEVMDGELSCSDHSINSPVQHEEQLVVSISRDLLTNKCDPADMGEELVSTKCGEELVVTIRTVVKDGKIIVVCQDVSDDDSSAVYVIHDDDDPSAMSDDISAVSDDVSAVSSDDPMSEDDASTVSNGVSVVSTDNMSIISSDFTDLDDDDDDSYVVSCTDLTPSDSGDELFKPHRLTRKKKSQTLWHCKELTPESDEYSAEDEEEEKPNSLGSDIPIAEYVSEKLVKTLYMEVNCTDKDIDKCVGQLLEEQYRRQKTVSIMDVDSILKLQAKSCALEKCSDASCEAGMSSDVANEVVISSVQQEDLAEQIPLSNSHLVMCRERVCNVSKHMLSYKTPVLSSSLTVSNSKNRISPQVYRRRISSYARS